MRINGKVCTEKLILLIRRRCLCSASLAKPNLFQEGCLHTFISKLFRF